MSTVTVSVPCQVVRVRVQSAAGRHVSPFELSMLRAVAAPALAAGAPGDISEPDWLGVEELDGLFGLGNRLTLDLVSDLWRKGYVTLDFHTGQVRPTRDVHRRAQLGTLEELAAASTSLNDHIVLVDRLSGHVYPVSDGHDRARELAVPVGFDGFTPNEIDMAALVNAVTETLRSEWDVGDDSSRLDRADAPVVLAATLPPADLQDPTEVRWVPMDVSVGWDRRSERPRVTVPSPVLDGRRRELAARRIAALVEEDPDSAFARTLLGTVSYQYSAPPALEAQLDRLDAEIRAAADVAPPNRNRHHLALASRANDIKNALVNRVHAEVLADPVVGSDDHDQRLRELVESARHQVVIAVGQVRYPPLWALRPALEAALRRGVRVLLLWGRSDRQSLDVEVANLLEGLQAAVNGPLLWDRHPSGIGANVVVADDRRALVSSYGFLDTPPARRGPASRDRNLNARSVGVLVQAPRPDDVCAPIEDLLAWGRRAAKYNHARLMLNRRSDFAEAGTGGEADADTSREAGPPSAADELVRGLGLVPEAPPEAAEDDAAAEVATELWRAHWAHHAATLRAAAAGRVLPWASLVEDGEHRDELWRVLDTTARRLAISGSRLGPDAVDGRLVAALRAAVLRNVAVSLRHGPAGAQGADDPQARLLRTLTDEFGRDRVDIRRIATNARVVVGDDVTVVGSSDPFVHGSAAGPAYRWAREVGLRVVGAALADTMAEVVVGGSGQPASDSGHTDEDAPSGSETGTGAGAHPSEPAGAAGDGSVTDWALGTAQRTLQSVAREPQSALARAALARKAVAAAPDPARRWALLHELTRPDAPTDVARAAVAAALLAPAGDDPQEPAVRQRWLHYLVCERWRAGAFVAAAVLRKRLIDPALPPRPPIALAAAAREARSPHLAAALEEAIFDAETTESERVGLLGLCVQTLLTGDEPAESNDVSLLLDLFCDDLPSPWRELGAAVQRWHQDAGVPVPIMRLQAAASARRQAAELEAAWDALVQALARARQTNFRFKAGSRTHNALFRSDGHFGQLEPHVVARDLGPLTAWAERQQLARIDRLLDDTTRAADPQGELMHSDQRRNYVDKLVAVRRAAKRVAALGDATLGQPGGLDAAQALLRELSRLRESMAVALYSLESTDRDLLRPCLQMIIDWGVA